MAQTHIPLPQFRTILFATDLSEPAHDAFSVACALAREGASRLIVLHVQEPLPTLEQVVGFGEFGVPLVLPVEAPTITHTSAKVQELYVPSEPVFIDYEVCTGDAAEEILAEARRADADLLVLGTHGRSGMDRLLMGSVAEAVVRHAPCPTLTLRSRGGEHTGAAGRPKLGTILLADDFSRQSNVALGVARGIARDHGAKLVLVHVVEPELGPSTPGEVRTHVEIGRDALEAARARIDGPDLKYPVESELRRGGAAAEILAVAADRQCDLIVMGTHGRSGLGRMLMGSVAEAVMRHAACPVLSVKVPTAAPDARGVAASAHAENLRA